MEKLQLQNQQICVNFNNKMTINVFFNHTVPQCKFTLKFQSRFTSILFKKFKVQFKKRNPGERRKKLDSVHSRALVSKSSRMHTEIVNEPFPEKFTPHSSMNDSCIIQQFSSDYSLREQQFAYQCSSRKRGK